MARKLANGLKEIEGIRITRPVDANGVFAIFPERIIKPLQEKYPFYVWNETISEVRLMCSFDTNDEEVSGFVRSAEALINA